MITVQVDRLRGDILSHSMGLLADDPRKLPEGFHSATVERGVAMLVEPLNSDTFVFVPPTTVHKFPAQPGSGTDKLRQRILASQFFVSVVENAAREANKVSRDPALARSPEQRAVKPC